jgi:outer membrane receptor protein involved in Fe transport
VTLYGNSSIGGAISAITRKPSFESGGYLRAGYEFEYREQRVDAGFDIPVNDQLALRVAGKWRDQGKGNAFNDYSGETEPRTGEAAIRFSARWLPSDALSVDFRHERGRFKRDGNIFDVYKHVDGQGQPWPNSTFTGIDDGRFNVGNGAPFLYQKPFMDTDMEETMVDLQYRFDRLTLTSITGLSRYDYQQSEDVDISPATLINVFQDESYRQFSQELRLAGKLSERLDFLAGLYYQDDSFRNDYLADFNLPELLAPIFGVPSSVTGQLISPFSRHILLDQDTRQWAIFGDVDWALTERLTASLGFRYLSIDKDARQAVRTASIDHVVGAGALVVARWLSPALAPLLLGNAAYLADPTHYVLVLPDGTQIAPVLVPGYALGYNIVSAGGGVTHEFDNLSRHEQHPMFQASLAYQRSPDFLIYANWANGAKAGGFDFLYEGGNAAQAQYDPEHANVFELGFKKDWRDVRLNLAAFYGKYADLQVSVYDGVIGFVVGNAASSISRGIDGELLWNISDRWRTHAQFEYLNFRYDKFTDANCSTTERLNTGAVLCDWSGRRTPFVPDFESTVAIEYDRPVGANWLLNQSLVWNYKGSHSTASDNEVQTRQSAYHLLDYRLELTPTSKAWSLALVGKNLTNQKYNVFTSVIPLAPGGAFANVRSKGREVGLEWQYRF